MNTSTMEKMLQDLIGIVERAISASLVMETLLPLIFYKYLSDIFEAHIYSPDAAGEYKDNIDRAKFANNSEISFATLKFPHEYRWEAIRNHPADGTLGQFVNTAMSEVALWNANLKEIVDIKDYNEYLGEQRVVDDAILKLIIDTISNYSFNTKNNDFNLFGSAYEYLLTFVSKHQGDKPIEFYTPKDVVQLMSKLLGSTLNGDVYDPACGSGCLSRVASLLAEERFEKSEKIRMYGQERLPLAYAVTKMDMLFYDFIEPHIVLGNTFLTPSFVDGKNTMKGFDYIFANPPWNMAGYDETFYKSDLWYRFKYGTPPRSSADWGWVQHIISSLKENGRAAVLLDVGAVSRGSGEKKAHKERNIRKNLVEQDIIEAVILLRRSLFYGTAAPSVLLLLNQNKSVSHKDQILFIDALEYQEHEKKSPLSHEDINAMHDLYSNWETRENVCRVVTLAELRSYNYDLSPLLLVSKEIEVYHRLPSSVEYNITKIRLKRELIDTELAAMLNYQGSYEAEDNIVEPFVTWLSFLDSDAINPAIREILSEVKEIREQELLLERELKDALMQHLFTYGTRNVQTHLTAVGRIPQDWNIVKLSDHAKIQSGFTPPKALRDQEGELIPWVKATDLKQGPVVTTTEMLPEATIDKGNRSSRRVLRSKGTVLIALYGGPSTVGKTGILDIQAATNQSICCIQPNTKIFDPYYLFCYLTSIRRSWIRYAIGSRLNIKLLTVQERLIPCPPLEQQDEITDKLRSRINRINILEREVAIIRALYNVDN